MNETQQIQTIDAHVVAYRNAEYHKTSKVKIDARKVSKRVQVILEELKNELTGFSQDQEVEIIYQKYGSGFINRTIYHLKVTQPLKLELYKGNDEHWQQSGQNVQIPKYIIEDVERITGLKFSNLSVHLGKLVTDRFGVSRDEETVTLEADFVKETKRKHYAL